MNSKERVLKTLNHKEPDRVPIGEWGIDHDHISKILGHHTYWRNRKDSTIALWEGRRDEVVESMKHDYVELIEKLDYDVIPVELVPPKGPAPEDPPKQISEGRWKNSKGDVFMYAASNDSIKCLSSNMPKENLTEEDIDKFRNNLTIDKSQFELIDYIAERYADSKAIVCRGIYVESMMLSIFGGDESHQLMMPLLAADDMKRLTKPIIEFARTLYSHCAEKGVLIGMAGHDFGTKNGLLMSPEVIRDIFMPVLRGINAEAEKLGMIPFCHSCGNCWELLDDYIDVGYQAYQSVQASAGMDWAELKHKYGDKLTLWAGVQCETLIEGSQKDVENEVNYALDVLMPGGGFIFGSTNSVQFGANTDNYLRALEIVHEKGIY